ncbi:MAG: ABC transporter ATP-binding protein [Sphaerochaetaceae bacterium]
MKNITKSYGNLVANDEVNLSLNKGEILAVVGENGAGKSTLMKILYGLESADSGTIYINDKPVKFRSPHDAIAHGIGMVQQHFMLFPSFTAAENIVYANETRKGIFFDRKKAAEEVNKLRDQYGLYVDPNIKVSACPVGLQQRIEILKVLYQGVDIIIFDEPSAVLTPQEISDLLQTIKDLIKVGKSIILITHKLSEVMAVADTVLVMRQGKVVKQTPKNQTSIDEMSYLMVGHHLTAQKIEASETKGVCLSIEDLVLAGQGAKNIITSLSLHVDYGEIVGIAGVSGNGQSELIACLTGLEKYQGGKVSIAGSDTTLKSPQEIRLAGCACIPEDRYFWGSASEARLDENVMMAHQNKRELCKRGIFSAKGIKDFSTDMLQSYDVRYTDLSQRMNELSGGNAQKLIVSREINQESPLLIAAEPTRGIDIGAIEFIHRMLLDKRTKGDAILLISSELSEILELSDRIYVLFEGKIVGEFTRETASSEKIGLLMMGGNLNDQ